MVVPPYTLGNGQQLEFVPMTDPIKSSTPAGSTVDSQETRTAHRRRAPKMCAWCGQQLGQVATGRPRKYCGAACRQRAYEQRQQLKGTGAPADAVIMSAETARKFHDELFELRCAAEDVFTAAQEREMADTIAELAGELMNLAQKLERIRGQR